MRRFGLLSSRLGPALLALLTSCRAQPSTALDETPASVLERLAKQGHVVDASLGQGTVRYLGFEAMPEGALPGDRVTLVHYWVASRPVDRPYRVFVHSLVDGARGVVPHGDHTPIPTPDHWPPGRVIRDEHALELPERLPADRVELRVGLYLGDQRMPVDRADQQDGDQRVLAQSFAVSGSPVPTPVYKAPRLKAPPLLDGTIEDAEWGNAPWIEGFTRTNGQGPSGLGTRARMGWDETHLYLAFVAEDPDIQGTDVERDAPIYRQEALEIFIDPTASRRDYVELEVSPRRTLFDAAFAGGARRNMDLGYTARSQVEVKVDGTVNDPSDLDREWRVEWAIEVGSIGGAAPRLHTGTKWRANLFRVAKDRVGGPTQDESAWSPPLMGDFHNLERFGEIWFSE